MSASTQVAAIVSTGRPVRASSTWCRRRPPSSAPVAAVHRGSGDRAVAHLDDADRRLRVERVLERDAEGVARHPQVAARVDDGVAVPGRGELGGDEVDELPLPGAADVEERGRLGPRRPCPVRSHGRARRGQVAVRRPERAARRRSRGGRARRRRTGRPRRRCACRRSSSRSSSGGAVGPRSTGSPRAIRATPESSRKRDHAASYSAITPCTRSSRAAVIGSAVVSVQRVPIASNVALVRAPGGRTSGCVRTDLLDGGVEAVPVREEPLTAPTSSVASGLPTTAAEIRR